MPSSTHGKVIVIGAGLAGMAAALKAQERGFDVTILEKTNKAQSGGNTRLAGGTIAVPTGPGEDASNDYFDDLAAKSQGRGNAALLRMLSRNVLADVEWLKGLGVALLPPRPVAPYRVNVVQAAPGQFLGMRPLLETLQSRFLAQGGALEFETKAERLVQGERGAVTGVQAFSREGVVDHAADAVVIATGGYTANQTLLTTFIHPDAARMVFRGVSWATGDGIVMAKACGAGLTRTAGVASLHIAAVSPDDPTHGIPDHAVPYCLALNVHGKRFHDEAEGYVSNGKAALAQPGQTIALVFDEEIRKQQRVTISVDTFRRLGLPVLEAASIEALAEQMKMPIAEVSRTIDEYNRAADGVRAAGLHPPKSALAARITVPKFYAFFPLVPGVTSTFGGVMIDGDARVLRPDGSPLQGLYAAGEGAGGLFDSDYIGGSSLANCLVMGRIAGRGAATLAET